MSLDVKLNYVDRLSEFTDNIHEATNKSMLDKLYLTYKDEIEALTKDDQKWFQNSYKEQIKFIKEREEKDADS